MKTISHSVQKTLSIGKAIGRRLSAGAIILLSGGLGSGKTVLAKGIAMGLGIKKEKVLSPTFVIMRVHKGRLVLYHFDLYRLQVPRDILNLGYEEYFYAEGAAVIEWPQRLKYLLPKEFLQINLSLIDSSKRCLQFKACGAKYKKILVDIYENIRH